MYHLFKVIQTAVIMGTCIICIETGTYQKGDIKTIKKLKIHTKMKKSIERLKENVDQSSQKAD